MVPGAGIALIQMNKEAIERMGWIIQKMRREGKRRAAPVYKAEAATDENSFKILIFTMLSARTKDDTTIMAIERLFKAASTPLAMESLGEKRVEHIIYGVGFHRVKARNVISICKMIRSRGVPDTLEGLLELPGVGRKTANIVLARAFGKHTLGVDVHVHRISNRLGIVRSKKPEETEEMLVRLLPADLLPSLNRNFVAFGQTVCLPRKPLCGLCPLNQICMRVGVKEPCLECRHGITSSR